MSSISLLNNEAHKNLRIITSHAKGLGDDVMSVPTFAAEFRNIQAHYPILFQENISTKKLFPVALFGFEEGENLYLGTNGWDASYIPLMIQRIPFSIGLYSSADGEAERKRLINIDVAHPRVSNNEGERLFGEHGESTPYLERISSMLETIHVWNKHTEEFISALQEYDLIEPVTMGITLRDGSQGQLIGFYSIHEERVAELGKEALYALHKNDFLQPIYMVIASLSNISKLIEKKPTTNISKKFG